MTRSYVHSQAPEGRSWFWTITARREIPSPVYNKGYSERVTWRASFAAVSKGTPMPIGVKVGQSKIISF
jgi:hypothetical protein